MRRRNFGSEVAAFAAIILIGCSHTPSAADRTNVREVFRSKLATWSAALPACPPDFPSTTVEAAVNWRWLTSECVSVRGRLLAVEPFDDTPLGQFCQVCDAGWVLWSLTEPPPRNARPPLASVRHGIPLVRAQAGDAPDCKTPVGGRLPRVAEEGELGAAIGEGLTPDVVVVGSVVQDPSQDGHVDFDSDAYVGVVPQPQDLAVWPLRVGYVCRLNDANRPPAR